MKHLFFILTLFLGTFSEFGTEAQQQLRTQLYEAYIQNDEAALRRAVTDFREAFEAKKMEVGHRFALAEAQCVLLTFALGNEKETLFEEYVGSTQELLEEVLEEKPKHAKAHALLAQVYGFRIAQTPWKGMFLGGKSTRHIALALQADTSEPTAWYQQANVKFNAPSAFGGDKEAAVRDYEKAVQLMEATQDLSHNWYYLDMLAWLGISYRETGQLQKAVSTFEKALRIEPRRDWIRDELLPDALKRSK